MVEQNISFCLNEMLLEIILSNSIHLLKKNHSKVTLFYLLFFTITFTYFLILTKDMFIDA